VIEKSSAEEKGGGRRWPRDGAAGGGAEDGRGERKEPGPDLIEQPRIKREISKGGSVYRGAMERWERGAAVAARGEGAGRKERDPERQRERTGNTRGYGQSPPRMRARFADGRIRNMGSSHERIARNDSLSPAKFRAAARHKFMPIGPILAAGD